jgi:ribosomal protein L11 methyltransferase
MASSPAPERKWIQVSAVFPEAPADWSPIHEIFAREGCPGTLEENDPPALVGFLYESPAEGTTFARLGKALLDAGAIRVEFSILREENWYENWKSHLKPRRIGNRLVVIPQKEDASHYDGEKDIVILLEPGQAFGTGEHPTTQLCLELLEAHLKPSMKILDVGTGSGILAIAAKKLGAREVVATEQDPTSAEVARENAEKNQVEITVLVTEQIPEDAQGFDLVVANLFSSTLVRLSHSLYRALSPGGRLIVSGVIPENWDEVRQALEGAGLKHLTTHQRDGWLAGTFSRPL